MIETAAGAPSDFVASETDARSLPGSGFDSAFEAPPSLDALELERAAAEAASIGDYRHAQRLLAQAISIGPTEWPRFRALSGYYAATGDLVAAREQAEKALQLAPADEWELRLHLGAVLNLLHEHEQAASFLSCAAAINPEVAECFHQLAWAAEQLGRNELAATLALKALRLDPDSGARARYAAHLLVVQGKKQEALALMREAAANGETDGHFRRALASLLMELGEEQAAADEFEALLRLEPLDNSFRVHVSHLLSKVGRHDSAVALIEAALGEESQNEQLKRHAVTIYLAAGRSNEALSAAAELLRLSPDNAEYLSCIRHVMRVRDDGATIAPSPVLLAKRGAVTRRARPPRTIADAVATQARVIWALLLREIRTRYGESRLGYTWALAEVAIHLGVLAIVFPFTMHGRPPIGDSFFFFYFTGLAPYLLFSHVTAQVGSGLVQNRPLLQLPQVTHFDVLIARGMLEFATILIVSLLFISAFLVAGVNALPTAPGAALWALLSAWLFALGVGSLNAVINAFTEAWAHVFSIVMRLLYFCSGIFYVPSAMPEWFRDILSWNPLMQDVDWFRTAFFPNYRPEWLAPTYPLFAALFAVLIGLSTEAFFRKQIQLAR